MMLKNFINVLFVFFVALFMPLKVDAVQFDLLVIPTDIFSVCDNYFCFPEVSNIIAEDSISNITNYGNINVKSLAYVRQKLSSDYQLKLAAIKVIDAYAKNDRIDFENLSIIAKNFSVKSILLIDTYTINDKTKLRRNLWDVLEVSSAFKITYPFTLVTSAVLIDDVNNLVMWSGRYSKNVSDSFGYFNASNQTQALSQLEKIKRYSYDIISKNLSQNIYMRFFPKDVRTFSVSSPSKQDNTPKFQPNALEHLSDPHIRKDFDDNAGKKFRDFDLEDFVF